MQKCGVIFSWQVTQTDVNDGAIASTLTVMAETRESSVTASYKVSVALEPLPSIQLGEAITGGCDRTPSPTCTLYDDVKYAFETKATFVYVQLGETTSSMRRGAFVLLLRVTCFW